MVAYGLLLDNEVFDGRKIGCERADDNGQMLASRLDFDSLARLLDRRKSVVMLKL